jgi:hypothetical protein
LAPSTLKLWPLKFVERAFVSATDVIGLFAHEQIVLDEENKSALLWWRGCNRGLQ